ncbi:multiple sugar-binding transport system permease protein MsmG [Clostridium pasteurianum DSM 525 = ATCC 6013]|uniref:ABC-type transporter, integral membrane subunit n=1 Tax=Clostridium pasteurianum DSM 525 = ATCC 6013 TaxID=1262449 RepID=A0A0H3J711_CLOPA|nr:carbohydrate ABC transporter permease [Clostridium pasteurianum]AJA49259.1 multiple sugar-binding transport system permease protein MsmG [Clostridium pasteurianum DSM 525 = ATCC 6013]AJA53247.1 multiple sugar-binding transport system permease protein MsmG [Clostridium pasteurianum DSM 525 = ATCC 6013]AOZ76437.1 ABC transporter permease [Clostridium pasteurianum DSM 525 = ATCC 6013]ELP58279.1 sugar ABC transporter permease [Clostridium pasteurianum DSM 525 = ATCC 6013]KRU14727.1 ABC-type tra
MKKKGANWITTIILAIVALVTIILPLYITVLIAIKSPEQMIPNALSFPKTLHFENFSKAIEMTNFFGAFKNSFIITVFVLILTILSNSLVAYAIARNRDKKFFSGLYYYFVSAMFVPFPIIMLPLVKQVSSVHMDNIFGIIFVYAVFGLPFNIFLYTGYIKSIPKSLEEAAIIDGATTFQVFRHVIFPLLKPINATVAITTCLWTWNDFLMPLILLSDSKMATLPLVQYVFKSQFATNYNLAFASYLLALLPLLIVYIFAQRWIRDGITTGAVK